MPDTLTRPRVPKNSAESSMTNVVQPPFAGLFCNGAANYLSSVNIGAHVCPTSRPSAEAHRPRSVTLTVICL